MLFYRYFERNIKLRYFFVIKVWDEYSKIVLVFCGYCVDIKGYGFVL